MPQSLTFNLIHLVFSTRDRRPLICEEMAPELYAYVATVARNLECECYRAGGMPDHVHLALRLAPNCIATRVVSELKTSSSMWMKRKGVVDFAWQRGYGLFSVSPADLPSLVRYIDGQREHHQRRSFQGEFRAFLDRYKVPYDERYIWG